MSCSVAVVYVAVIGGRQARLGYWSSSSRLVAAGEDAPGGNLGCKPDFLGIILISLSSYSLTSFLFFVVINFKVDDRVFFFYVKSNRSDTFSFPQHVKSLARNAMLIRERKKSHIFHTLSVNFLWRFQNVDLFNSGCHEVFIYWCVNTSQANRIAFLPKRPGKSSGFGYEYSLHCACNVILLKPCLNVV